MSDRQAIEKLSEQSNVVLPQAELIPEVGQNRFFDVLMGLHKQHQSKAVLIMIDNAHDRCLKTCTCYSKLNLLELQHDGS